MYVEQHHFGLMWIPMLILWEINNHHPSSEKDQRAEVKEHKVALSELWFLSQLQRHFYLIPPTHTHIPAQIVTAKSIA